MFKKISYLVGVILFGILSFLIVKNANLNNFVDMVENRTFDLRQSVMINLGIKKADENIVIAAIDDASYEYILTHYGEWPLPRDVYADVVNYLQKYNPDIIAFDLMFVNSMKSDLDADIAISNAVVKNDNVFVAMNFDVQPKELRTPPVLPKELALNVNNTSKIDFSEHSYTNCRTIISSILNYTKNIGIINVSRADDGILRKMPLFIKYNDEFYPQLALKIANKHFEHTEQLKEQNQYTISKEGKVNIAGRDIYLDKDGSVILNWYGPTGSYDYIPMYQLIKAANGEINLDYDFSNKIIYFGTTAASLYDIKTVPVGKLYPGVEVQATYVNNFINNDFIHKIDKSVTMLISILLATLVILCVAKIVSAFLATITSISLYFLFFIITYYLMAYANLWVEVVYPTTFGVLAFTCAFIVKYLIKSRDFDQQYKLATTDGLTELYNHRYFQEQMKMLVEQSKRYGTEFSLIIVDIDYFKKFNDTYGHQVGDAVLKLVAATLKRNVRATDIVCRYGGEEMSIILPNTGKTEAISTAEKLCRKIEENKLKLNGKEIGVTISLGVSTFPKNGDTPAQIIEHADAKLYSAKNNGRNQVGK